MITGPVVYFVQINDPDSLLHIIKIGVTRRLEHRMAGLETSCPFHMQLLGVIQYSHMTAARRNETKLHKKFHRYHYKGEWFKPGSRLLRFITRHTHSANEQRTVKDYSQPAPIERYECKPLLTPKEVSQKLDLPYAKVLQYMHEYDIPRVQIGNKLFRFEWPESKKYFERAIAKPHQDA